MIKKLSTILVMTSLISSAAAADLPIEKLTKKEDIFIIKQTPETTVKKRFYVYQADKLQALGEIILCKNNRCLGQVKKKNANFKLSEQDLVSLSPKRKAVAKKVSEGAKEVPASHEEMAVNQELKKDIKSPTTNEFSKSVAGQYGGPLSSGLSANFILSKGLLSYYAGVGIISGSVSDVEVSGYGVSAGLSYDYYQYGKIHFLGKFLFDAYSASLDFTSSRIPLKEDVMLLNAQFLQTFEYRFANSFAAGLDLGIGFNTLEQDYVNSLGDELGITFAGALIQTNLFLRYFF